MRQQPFYRPQNSIRNSVKFFYILCVCVLRCFSCVQLFETTWTVAHQAPLSMEFSRQEYWNGFLFPSLGDLPNPGIEPGSPTLQADSCTILESSIFRNKMEMEIKGRKISCPCLAIPLLNPRTKHIYGNEKYRKTTL